MTPSLLRQTCFIFGFVATLAQAGSFAIVGDAGRWNSTTRGTRDSIARAGVTQLILPGDNLYDAELKYADAWNPWLEAGLTFDVVAIGNHRRTTREEVAYFNMPGEYYAKRFGAVRFFVLNSDNDWTARTQASWLDGQLAAASASDFNFVVFHHPPATISGEHRWEERPRFQTALLPVLDRHAAKIRALLVGHDHFASLVDFGGMPMVVSGAGWEAREAEPVDSNQRGRRVRTEWLYDRGPYWTRLDVNESTREVWIHFIRTDTNVLKCSVRLYPSRQWGAGCRS